MKIKNIEAPGPTVKSQLQSSDPFPRESCGRDQCPLSDKDPIVTNGEEPRGCKCRCYDTGVNYHSNLPQKWQPSIGIEDVSLKGKGIVALSPQGAKFLLHHPPCLVQYRSLHGSIREFTVGSKRSSQ